MLIRGPTDIHQWGELVWPRPGFSRDKLTSASERRFFMSYGQYQIYINFNYYQSPRSLHGVSKNMELVLRRRSKNPNLHLVMHEIIKAVSSEAVVNTKYIVTQYHGLIGLATSHLNARCMPVSLYRGKAVFS